MLGSCLLKITLEVETPKNERPSIFVANRRKQCHRKWFSLAELCWGWRKTNTVAVGIENFIRCEITEICVINWKHRSNFKWLVSASYGSPGGSYKCYSGHFLSCKFVFFDNFCLANLRFGHLSCKSAALTLFI